MYAIAIALVVVQSVNSLAGVPPYDIWDIERAEHGTYKSATVYIKLQSDCTDSQVKQVILNANSQFRYDYDIVCLEIASKDAKRVSSDSKNWAPLVCKTEWTSNTAEVEGVEGLQQFSGDETYKDIRVKWYRAREPRESETTEKTEGGESGSGGIQLSGRGQQASKKFQLKSGLAVFEMKHVGSSNFSVFLMNSNGEIVELLANDIGSFNGSKAAGIPFKGTYILDIQASDRHG
jgi:hypothetical protein